MPGAEKVSACAPRYAALTSWFKGVVERVSAESLLSRPDPDVFILSDL